MASENCMMLLFEVVLFIGLASHISAKLLDPRCMKPAPAGVDPENCCPMPEFITPAILKECVSEVFGNEDQLNDTSTEANESYLFSPSIRCLSECVFNKSGILNNGEMLAEKFTENIDEVWVPVVQEAFKVCQSIVNKTQFEKPNEGECCYKPTFYIACLDTQVFKNCPAAAWNPSEDCNNLRSITEICPIAVSVLRGEG